LEHCKYLIPAYTRDESCCGRRAREIGCTGPRIAWRSSSTSDAASVSI
jgi:hypothetical protein